MATVTEAEGFAELELWQDAWDALEDIAAEERMNARVWGLRLRCCMALDSWEMGQTLADLLRHGDEDDRALAASYYHSLAVREMSHDQEEAAREAVKTATAIYPPWRVHMLDDHRLEDLF